MQAEFIRSLKCDQLKDWAYQYDALNRLTQVHENHGNETRNYQYDSLGNLTYEWNSNNVIVDYKLNNLNQITQKTDDGWKTWTDYSYDKRGNTIQKIYNKNNKHTVIGSYVYDETNRMTQGTNDIGEQSTYHFNGLGILVTNEWLIKKNAYGYHDVTAATVLDPGEELVIEPTTGEKKAKGKKKPEEVAVDPELNKTSHVIKDFVIDYNSDAQENLMEYELYDEGLTYRYVYGEDKLGVTVYPIPNGSASVTTPEDTIPLYYHMDHMGSSEFLTSDVTQRVTSWTSYDEWGNITHNAVLKCGQRELDLVKNYTGHERDSVLGMYYAKARLYDTADKHGSTKGNKLGDKRFMAVDPVKGDTRNPQSMVQYTYTLNNPLMYVDPLGLFQSGDVLQKEGWFRKKTNNYNDMVDLQIRLMTTGYLTADDLNFTAGKFNGTVEKAVKKFQGQNGLDTNGKVDEATWRALGLWVMEEGTLTISAPNTTVDPDIEWGVNAAQEDLIKILAKVRNVPELRLANGNIISQWNLQYFTYYNSYYIKMQCVKGEPSVLGLAAKGYDVGSSIVSGFSEAVAVVPPMPNPYVYGTAVLAATAFSAYCMYQAPGAQAALDAYYEAKAYNDIIKQAEAELDLIDNSILRYVIAPDMAGNNYWTVVNIYNNDIAKKAYKTISQDGAGSVQNLPVKNKAYINYLENVMRINFDKNSHQFYLKTILP